MIDWKNKSETMLESVDKVYQISRSPLENGRLTYRAWRRSHNEILTEVSCFNTAEERADAVAKCKAVCELLDSNRP